MIREMYQQVHERSYMVSLFLHPTERLKMVLEGFWRRLQTFICLLHTGLSKCERKASIAP